LAVIGFCALTDRRVPQHVNMHRERQPSSLPARSTMRPMPIRPNGWPRSLMKT
jgi:hypothetical protein